MRIPHESLPSSMCGRFASFHGPAVIRDAFSTAGSIPNIAPSWNVTPTQAAMVRRASPRPSAVGIGAALRNKGRQGKGLLAKNHRYLATASSDAPLRFLALFLPSRLLLKIATDSDIASMRAALKGIGTLFLLNAVAPEELTQAVITLDLAREAGVTNLVYLSVIHADRFSDVPHFTGKAAVERMIADIEMPATILRPGYYMQNDATLKDAVLGDGVYSIPLGTAGTLMVDTRDLAEVAAIDLMRRDASADPLPTETIDVVNPEVLSGPGIADIWSQLLGRTVTYGGDNLDALEQSLQQFMPSWMAYDMRMMMRRFQEDGMSAEAGDDARLRERLGRPMRTYRAFADETAAAWKEASA